MPKPDPLYVTEEEIARRLGLPLVDWQIAAPMLERQGLPLPENLFGRRRYWPACRAFLDRRYGIGPSGLPATALDGEENWGG